MQYVDLLCRGARQPMLAADDDGRHGIDRCIYKKIISECVLNVFFSNSLAYLCLILCLSYYFYYNTIDDGCVNVNQQCHNQWQSRLPSRKDPRGSIPYGSIRCQGLSNKPLVEAIGLELAGGGAGGEVAAMVELL